MSELQPAVKEVDVKVTRAEAALTQLLTGDERDGDVTLSSPLISAIETFHSNLAAASDDLTDEDIQHRLMVRYQRML